MREAPPGIGGEAELRHEAGHTRARISRFGRPATASGWPTILPTLWRGFSEP